MSSASRFDDPEQLLADRAWLVRMASALLGDRDEAEDVAQEAQLRAMSSPPRAGEERPWLRRVARSLALRLRSRREWRATWERRAAQSEKLPSSDELVARVEAQRAVAETVLALGEPYREVVLLRYFDDLKPAEIAARLATPVETVRTRLKRALAQLRARLDATHGGRDAWSALLAPWIGVAKAGGGAKALLAAGVVVAGVVAWRVVVGDGAVTSPAAAREPAPVVSAADPQAPASEHRVDAASARTGTGAVRSTDVVVRGGIVHVVDGDGRSIEGAHLFVGPRDHATSQLATDVDGRAPLPESIEESWLAVAAPGFQPAERVLRRPRKPELEVVLRSATTIEGIVQSSDPIEVRAGLRVVAIAADDACSVAHLEAICAGRAPGPLATTDERGAFTLEGLDPQKSYVVVAGGGGYVSMRTNAVAAGTKDVVVTVGVLYGVDVQIRQAGGRPLPFSDWFGPRRALEMGQDDVVTDAYRPIVAGIPPEQRSWNRSHVLLLHVRATCEGESLGQRICHIDEAGFVSNDFEVDLPRLEDSVPVVCAELAPLPDVRFGRLTIEILGEDAALATGAGGGLLGELRLTPPPELTNQRFWETGIRIGGGHRQVITGVPVADYQWQFMLPFGESDSVPFDRSGSRSTIGFENDAATVTLDLRDCGDVQFDVSHRDGSAYVGALHLGISSAIQEQQRDRSATFVESTRAVLLDDPPYVVRAIHAGRYVVRPSSAQNRYRRGLPSDADPPEFDVTAGAITHCALTIDD